MTKIYNPQRDRKVPDMDRWQIRRRTLRLGVALVMSLALAACATTRSAPALPSPAPVAPAPVAPASAPTQYGVASWYGPGFNGQRTSTGEIYDQNDLTAASMVYPLGSHVMVTNLDNGRSVEVTINDHGPLKKGRKIDLSHKAAAMLGMLGPGTAKVRIELLAAPPNSRPVGSQPRYFVQVGSFASSSHAREVSDQLSKSYPDVRVDQVAVGQRRYYRVRMGAFESRAAAQARAAEAARRGYPIVIVSD
jgi:rare lipoprotein A